MDGLTKVAEHSMYIIMNISDFLRPGSDVKWRSGHTVRIWGERDLLSLRYEENCQLLAKMALSEHL